MCRAKSGTRAMKCTPLEDNYKVLIEKKKAFLRNEDIWIMAAEKRGAAQCTTSVDGSKPKKKKNAETLRSRIPSESDDTDIGTTVSGTIKRKRTKTATERVLSQLKSSLLNRKPTTSTPSHSEEDDPDIDTNVDLFDPPQASGLTLSDDELESRQRPAFQASQPVTEVRSHAESAGGLDLSYYEESELPKEDKDEQPEAVEPRCTGVLFG
ncbi:hypothetical protein MHYP_G00017510 [Metynnis hypsauchen]